MQLKTTNETVKTYTVPIGNKKKRSQHSATERRKERGKPFCGNDGQSPENCKNARIEWKTTQSEKSSRSRPGLHKNQLSLEQFPHLQSNIEVVAAYKLSGTRTQILLTHEQMAYSFLGHNTWARQHHDLQNGSVDRAIRYKRWEHFAHEWALKLYVHKGTCRKQIYERPNRLKMRPCTKKRT